MQQGSPTGRMATKILNERRVLPYQRAHGVAALFYNTGSFNMANDAHALHWNTTGFNNTANGIKALVTNTTGTV